MPVLQALVSKMKCLEKLGKLKTGVEVIAVFKATKTLSSFFYALEMIILQEIGHRSCNMCIISNKLYVITSN